MSTDQKPNAWPKFVWGLFAFSLLISCAVLVCLGWYGLTGSGLPASFPTWLPSVAACFTLICTIVNISSTNPNTYEILIPDSIQIGLWVSVIVRLALYISDTGSFGSCTNTPSMLKSSCVISQLVLWAGVALVNISFAKLATAFYVRRAARYKPNPESDCEKLCVPPLQTFTS